jgi:hypothetical protein
VVEWEIRESQRCAMYATSSPSKGTMVEREG